VCGIVTYERKADGSFGCSLALLPAPSCQLRTGSAAQGVLLYPREQVTRLTTDPPTSNRRLVFPGTACSPLQLCLTRARPAPRHPPSRVGIAAHARVARLELMDEC
jgi:hypothetical protein